MTEEYIEGEAAFQMAESFDEGYKKGKKDMLKKMNSLLKELEENYKAKKYKNLKTKVKEYKDIKESLNKIRRL